MPWLIKKRNGKFAVYKEGADGEPVGDALGTHDTEEEAKKQMKALYSSESHMRESLEFDGTLVESADGTLPKGSVWNVTIIKAGTSKEPRHMQGVTAPFHYSADVLTKAVPMFEGAQVFAHRKAPHVTPAEATVQDAVGWLSEVAMDGDAMRGKLNILPSASWLRENLVVSTARGKRNLYSLSINAVGASSLRRMDAKNSVFYVEQIADVKSVDVVPRGAAGGAIDNLVEAHTNTQPHSERQTTMYRDKILSLLTLFYPAFMEAKTNIDWTKPNENELFSFLLEADKAQPRLHLPDGAQLTEAVISDTMKKAQELLKGAPAPTPPAPAPSPAPVALTEAVTRELAEVKKALCANMLEAKLATSNLPNDAAATLRKRYEGKVFTEAELSDDIKGMRDLLAKVFSTTPASHFVEAGTDESEKAQLALDGFFLCSSQALKPLTADEKTKMLKGVPAPRSFREAYTLYTGDVNVTGLRENMTRLTESVTTVEFAKAVADAMNKRMVRDYGALALDTWRPFTDIVPLNDFKTQHRIRFGGYSNLPTVVQGAAYTSLSSPTDEEATYTATKKGGTEDMTREVIKNDDVGAIQRIPSRLARAAAQTLHEFVYDLINPAVNANIYDSAALYNNTAESATGSGHANYGTAALDSAGLLAARLRMKKHMNRNAQKRLGIRAGWLLVPPDLEATAWALLFPAAGNNNMVPTFAQQLGIAPVTVDYWTDTNNWALVAKREDCVGLEVGFVDGQEEPQLFVSDIANVGSFFTNDKVTFKIRHEYGGAVTDFRAFDGSVV